MNRYRRVDDALHIGFDISQTGNGKAGCGFFAHALIKSLLEVDSGQRYSLFPSFGDFYFDPLMPLRNPYPGPRVQYGPRHASRETARAFWSRPELETALDQPDLIHANNYWCPIQLRSTRLVYTCYDFGFTIDPSWTTETNRAGCFEGVFRSSLAADWVLAVSNASRDDYLACFPHFPAERIRVIHPSSRFTDTTLPGKRPKALSQIEGQDFWLSVGTLEPRKNHEMLVEAYAQYRAQGGKPMPLVLAGGRGWLMEHFSHHLTELGIAGDVIMTGYVTDDELIWLYRHCFANLYPSLFEGFGLPVLEGLQFGAATLSANTSSLPEVAGDAAILLDPGAKDAWAAAMLAIASNTAERHLFRDRAVKHAARFSWRSTARQVLELYAEAIKTPKRPILAIKGVVH